MTSEENYLKWRILINAIPWMLLHSDTATSAAFFHSPTPLSFVGLSFLARASRRLLGSFAEERARAKRPVGRGEAFKGKKLSDGMNSTKTFPLSQSNRKIHFGIRRKRSQR